VGRAQRPRRSRGVDFSLFVVGLSAVISATLTRIIVIILVVAQNGFFQVLVRHLHERLADLDLRATVLSEPGHHRLHRGAARFFAPELLPR
jgi:hypothetical protein